MYGYRADEGNAENLFKRAVHRKNLLFVIQITILGKKYMATGKHILFWLIVSVLLIFGFGETFNDLTNAFYFVTFLLPVAMATSYFFNYYLVPKFLFTKKHIRFTLYTIYTIIISLCLQMLVITLSFILIANYDVSEMSPLMTNIFVLAAIIYLIVLLKAFFLLYRKIRNNEFEVEKLKREKDALETDFITVRSNRKNVQLQLSEIIFLESLGDYVKIKTTELSVITNENISAFEDSLPGYFIRIHRSFIVNRHYVTAFNSRELSAADVDLPISRTYKRDVLHILGSNV